MTLFANFLPASNCLGMIRKIQKKQKVPLIHKKKFRNQKGLRLKKAMKQTQLHAKQNYSNSIKQKVTSGKYISKGKFLGYSKPFIKSKKAKDPTWSIKNCVAKPFIFLFVFYVEEQLWTNL